MKSTLARFIRPFLFALLAAALFALPVFAQSDPAPNPFVDFLQPFLVQFASLGGIASLIAAAVNGAKSLGWLKDGDAPIAVLVANAGGFALFFGAKLLIPGFDVPYADGVAGQIAVVLVNLLQLGTQLGLTKVFHTGFKGLPVIGTSFSLKGQ